MPLAGAKGPPIVPTAPSGDCSNRAASTEFVCNASGGTGATGPTGPAGPTGATGTSYATNFSGGNPSSFSTTSLTGVMAGYGFQITPIDTGHVWVGLAGMAGNSVIGDGANIIGRYGVGGAVAAPAAGAAPTGTQFGATQAFVASTSAGRQGFMTMEILTLVPGTPYWFDVELQAVTGGTATIGNGVEFFMFEL